MGSESARFDFPGPARGHRRRTVPARFASLQDSANARALRSWLGIAAAVAALGLLLAFHQVVRGAVQQAELRHKASAMHAAAVVQCSMARTASMRDECLAGLNGARPGEVPVRPAVYEMIASK